MRILLTNDDGIMAPGIQALAKRMVDLGEVVLVAPDTERSASGHGITILDPIRVKPVKISSISEAWAISGTPADCVKMAVQEFFKDGCDMILSGINHGPNLGTDVLYSGTVSAAIEGSILGIPSVAVSLASFAVESDYSLSADIAHSIAEQLFKKKANLPPNTLLNVNIPDVEANLIKGYRITKLGVREYSNVFDRLVDPRGNTYYWLKGELVKQDEMDPDLDTVAIKEKYISISPVHFDLTNYRIMKDIRKCGFEELSLNI